MQTETIISLLIAGCALLFTAMNYRRTSTQDTSVSATERATMTADIRYIRSSIDEIKLENKSIQKELGDIKTKLVEVEQSTKSAHKRLDDMKKGNTNND